MDKSRFRLWLVGACLIVIAIGLGLAGCTSINLPEDQPAATATDLPYPGWPASTPPFVSYPGPAHVSPNSPPTKAPHDINEKNPVTQWLVTPDPNEKLRVGNPVQVPPSITPTPDWIRQDNQAGEVSKLFVRDPVTGQEMLEN